MYDYQSSDMPDLVFKRVNMHRWARIGKIGNTNKTDGIVRLFSMPRPFLAGSVRDHKSSTVNRRD